MKASKNRFTPFITVVSLIVISLLFASSGCDNKSKLPLFEPNLTPQSVLRIMHRRSLMFGGADADLSIEIQTASKKINLKGALAFDVPDLYRMQFSYPGEPPVIEFVLRGRKAMFYSPGSLKKLDASLDALLEKPNGLFAIAEATLYSTGDLLGFQSYGVQVKTQRYVYFKKIGEIELRAFVNRATLTLTSIVFTRGENEFLAIEYSDYSLVEELPWPQLITVTSPQFQVSMKTDSLEHTGRHSITVFSFEELPGTEDTFDIDGFLKGVLWQD